MKGAKWVLSLLVILGLCGCMKFDQEITLNKDGSGSVSMMYAMSEAVIQQMEAMAEMGKQMVQEGAEIEEEDKPFEFDEAKIKEEFEGMKDKGIELTSVKSETKDGWKYTYVDFTFKDVGKLKELDEFKEDSFSIVKNPEGNYVITMKMGSVGTQAEPQDEAQLQQMMPMIQGQGMEVASKFTVPTKIIETNAPLKEGKSAGFEVDVDKDPDAFLALSKMGEVTIVFDGKGCSIPEVK